MLAACLAKQPLTIARHVNKIITFSKLLAQQRVRVCCATLPANDALMRQSLDAFSVKILWPQSIPRQISASAQLNTL